MSVLTACSELRNLQAATVCEEVFSASQKDPSLQRNVFLNTSVIRTLHQCKRPAKALELWDQLKKGEQITWDRVAFICVLSACANVGREALSTGEAVRAMITLEELKHDTRLLSSLINMYAKCGSPKAAIQLAEDLWSRGIVGDKSVFTSVLSACIMVGPSALPLATRIHQVVSSTCGYDVRLFGILCSMYHRCGKLTEVLDVWWDANGRKLADYDVCNTVLIVCTQLASNEALEVCRSMHGRICEIAPGGSLHLPLISCYYQLQRPHLVLSTWREAVQIGVTADITTQRNVLHACAEVANSDALDVAHQLFSKCKNAREQLYDAMLKVYLRSPQPHRAIEFWNNVILPHSPQPGRHAILSVLHACATTRNLNETTSIYASVILPSPELMQHTEVITSVIHAYTQCNRPDLALKVWKSARENSIALNRVGITCVLQACAQLGSSPDVHQAVEELVNTNVQMDERLFSAALNVYIKCGLPERALQYFFQATERDSWLITCVAATTALKACAEIGNEDSLAAGERIIAMVSDMKVNLDIKFENACMSLFTQCGKPSTALRLWDAMHGRPTAVSYVCALSACAASGPSELHSGQQIHSQMPEKMQRDPIVASALIAMYMRCGQPISALKIWQEMLQNGIDYNTITCISVLRACAAIGTPGSLAIGTAVHKLITSDVLLHVCAVNL